ncbi:MAG: hypothetical protein HOO93_16345, partial [Methyloglobulus sp.]|nr:hypothetical protein [Methyloglobulus sp.]
MNPNHNATQRANSFKEPLIKSFDRLRTNGNELISFVVSLSNHEQNQLVQRFLNSCLPPLKAAILTLVLLSLAFGQQANAGDNARHFHIPA